MSVLGRKLLPTVRTGRLWTIESYRAAEMLLPELGDSHQNDNAENSDSQWSLWSVSRAISCHSMPLSMQLPII